MHRTAMHNAKRFFDTYAMHVAAGATVLDIGVDTPGTSLKKACPANLKYLGVDLMPGPGVDVVLEDPYKFPFADESAGIVVSSSCFEHSEMFWLLYLEIMRVLAPSGLLYLNVPSNGNYHRYPVDCWRFYPDSGIALVQWGRRNGMNNAVLESYTSNQSLRETWNDFVCVLIKDESRASQYPRRIIDSFTDFSNGLRGPLESGYETNLALRNPHQRPQDQRFYGWKLHKRLQKLRWYCLNAIGAAD
jgi:SAM-dependent methyltransferase